MQKKLKSSISKLVTEQYKEKATKDMKDLLFLTEKVITKITNNPIEQQKEIIRLYNFYWLSIYNAYEVISVFSNTQ